MRHPLSIKPPWWLWPAFLASLAALTLLSSFVLHPGPDEFCYLPGGMKFGDTCAITQVTGLPCPQCGMTRSFVHGVRGHFASAFLYNPAGFGLLVWILSAGFVGAVRLVTRNPTKLKPPVNLLFAWTVIWLLVYTFGWFARLKGINVLPG